MASKSYFTSTIVCGRLHKSGCAVYGKYGCASSKPDPHGLIGGFDRLRIACLHGDAQQMSPPVRWKGTPNPHDDARTVRHPGYAVSQWIRKRVKETFGWMKTIGGLRRTRYRGRQRVQMHAYLVAASYNLLRIARLSAAPA
jgi:hypothetical protein